MATDHQLQGLRIWRVCTQQSSYNAIFTSLYGNSFINGAGVNNPTYEFFPPKNINGQ